MGIPRWRLDGAGPGRSGSRGVPDEIGPAGPSGRAGSRRGVPGWNHDAVDWVSHGAAAVTGAAVTGAAVTGAAVTGAAVNGAAVGGGAGTPAGRGCGPVSQGASG